ncbi:MAG: cytochrome c, partial [bacterium]
MKNLRGWMYSGVAVAALGLLAGCAETGKMAKKPGSPAVAARRKLMLKGNLPSFIKIKKALKAGDAKAAAAAARVIIATAKKIPGAFAKKDLRGNTLAKAKIWAQKTEFDQYAANLKLSAEIFLLAAEGGDKTGMKNGSKTIINACNKCHGAYRKKRGPKKVGVGGAGARVKASGA